MKGGVFRVRGKEGERGTSGKMKENNSCIFQSDLFKPSMSFMIFQSHFKLLIHSKRNPRGEKT